MTNASAPSSAIAARIPIASPIAPMNHGIAKPPHAPDAATTPSAVPAAHGTRSAASAIVGSQGGASGLIRRVTHPANYGVPPGGFTMGSRLFMYSSITLLTLASFNTTEISMRRFC